jgi:hypothetical protein
VTAFCEVENMKRLLAGTLLLCSLVSANAFANTIIYLIPNDGSGDNFGFITYGPGFYITGDGGTPPDFFYNIFPGYAPGSTLGGSTPIYFADGSARIGAISYDVTWNLGGTLFMSTIKFPTNGQDFRAQVDIGIDATGTLVTMLGQPIHTSGGAEGYIKFDYVNGMYYPEGFVQVPEPATLELAGIGLLWVFTRVRTRGSS